MHNIFGIDFATENNQTFAIQACREACYSDLDCNYWQYIQETGCWSEAASENSNVPNPLTNGDVDRVLSGVTILSGDLASAQRRMVLNVLPSKSATNRIALVMRFALHSKIRSLPSMTMVQFKRVASTP